MANVTLQMDRSIAGYGTTGDVITTTQTAQTDAMVANGQAHVYTGPITPTSVALAMSRSIAPSATALTLAAPAGQDVVTILTAAAAVPTLPTAVGNSTHYTIKNNSGGSITPATTSSQTIDGVAPAALANKAAVRLISDGANWLTV